MKRMLMTTAAILSAVALSGCYDFHSDVSAISESARLTEAPFLDGRYCLVDLDHDDAGAIEDVDIDDDDCFPTRFDAAAKELVLDPVDDEDGPDVILMADLGRGATLFQMPDQGGNGFALNIGVTTEDVVAIVPSPPLTAETIAAAQAAGVVLDALDFDPADTTPPNLDIMAGDSDAILGVLRDAVGRNFDAALRDPALRETFLNHPTLYVRIDEDADPETLGMAELGAQIEAVQARIERAMTLE